MKIVCNRKTVRSTGGPTSSTSAISTHGNKQMNVWGGVGTVQMTCYFCACPSHYYPPLFLLPPWPHYCLHSPCHYICEWSNYCCGKPRCHRCLPYNARQNLCQAIIYQSSSIYCWSCSGLCFVQVIQDKDSIICGLANLSSHLTYCSLLPPCLHVWTLQFMGQRRTKSCRKYSVFHVLSFYLGSWISSISVQLPQWLCKCY